MKRSATKAEREHMTRVAELGCIPCIIMGIEGTPAAIHHAKEYGGQKRNHMKVIGMCGDHHQTGKISRHGVGAMVFKNKFGDDTSLLEIVNKLLGI